MTVSVICEKGHKYLQADLYIRDADWPRGAPTCPTCFEEWRKAHSVDPDVRPICPYCNERMVRAHLEFEDHWRVVWLCGCQPEPMTIADLRAPLEWVTCTMSYPKSLIEMVS